MPVDHLGIKKEVWCVDINTKTMPSGLNISSQSFFILLNLRQHV